MRLSSHHPLYITRKRQENMNDKTLEKHNFTRDLEYRDNSIEVYQIQINVRKEAMKKCG